MKRISIEFTAPDDVDTDDILTRTMEALNVSSLSVSSSPAQHLMTFEFHGTFTLTVQQYTEEEATLNVRRILDDTFDDYEITEVL